MVINITPAVIMRNNVKYITHIKLSEYCSTINANKYFESPAILLCKHMLTRMFDSNFVTSVWKIS